MPQLSLSLITVNYSKLYLCCNYLFTTFSAQFRFISEKRWLNNFQVKRFTNTQVMSRINTNISFKKLLFRGNSLTLSLSSVLLEHRFEELISFQNPPILHIYTARILKHLITQFINNFWVKIKNKSFMRCIVYHSLYPSLVFTLKWTLPFKSQI